MIGPRLKRISGVMPVLVLSLFLLAALFPWLLAPVASEPLDVPYLEPDTRHLLGTGSIGQDVLTELIYSARISLFVAFLASITATFLGTLVGMVSGYREGAWDQWLMRFTDVFLLLPSLPLIILLSAYMDAGVFGIALVIGMTAWPATARVVRANVRQERGKNFIRSAQTFGAGHLYMMGVHILPNISQVVLAKGTLAAATAMVAEAGVSFLGLGDPAYKSWGSMLHEAFTSGGLLNGAYLWYMSPVVCISLTVLSLTLMGQRWIEAGEEESLVVGARGKDVLRSSPPRITPRLRVKGLSVDFPKHDGTLFRALDRLEMTVNENDRLAIVGETGSGKSVLLLALMGLLPRNAAATGEILLGGANLCTLSEKGFQRLRGKHVAYVPQGAGHALNPLMRVGFQVAEPARVHLKMPKDRAMGLATKMLAQMGIFPAHRHIGAYPHQYSGGMIQRALTAMGLISGASLILLDEPTKGLDPHSRDHMLGVLKGLEQKTVVMVTHDLAFAQGFADRMGVMLGAGLVELADAKDFFERPLHPYAQALLRAQPRQGLRVREHCSDRVFHGSGCPFEGRCPKAFSKCREMPPMKDVGGRWVRCWHHAA